MKTTTELNTTFAIAALGALLASGCQPVALTSPSASTQNPTVKQSPYTPKAEAGIPVNQSTDTTRWEQLVASRGGSYGKRNDPFGLSTAERAFDAQQSAERLFSGSGGWQSEFTPPSDAGEVAPVFEPQPYRRLSGVVVGDQVVAIIEMEGNRTFIVRPGQMIPNTEWRVVSIDENRAVLRRAGNKLPRQIEVRLETPPEGFSGATTPPAGGGQNPFGPGGPGGPPPGFMPPGGGQGSRGGSDF